MSKRRVIVLISFISLIVIIAAGAWVVNRVRLRLLNNLVDQYYNHELALAEEVSNILKVDLQGLKDKLEIMTYLDVIRNPVSAEKCNATLQMIKDGMEARVNNLGRVDVNGKFVCSLNPGLIGQAAANYGEYINEIFSDPEHKPVMSRVTRVPNVEGFVFALHIPVYNDKGEFDGTLGGAIYFDYFDEAYLSDVKFANSGYVALFDDNFDILYHPQRDVIGQNIFDPERLEASGNNPINLSIKKAIEDFDVIKARYQTNSGERISVFYPMEIIPGRTWLVSVVTPVVEVQNSLVNAGTTRDFIGLTSVMIILITLPTVVTLYYLNRTLFRPIRNITESIKEISEGHYTRRVPYTSLSPRDEVNQLAIAFNKMATKLESQHNSDKVANAEGPPPMQAV